MENDKTTIQVYKKDLPRINTNRSQTGKGALSQPRYISLLLDKEDGANIAPQITPNK